MTAQPVGAFAATWKHFHAKSVILKRARWRTGSQWRLYRILLKNGKRHFNAKFSHTEKLDVERRC